MEESMNEILYCSDEEDPYIEIELDTAVTTNDENNNNCMDDDVELEQEEEYKLRISISSTISVSLQKESIISVDGAAEIGATQAPMSLQQQHSGVSHNDEVEFPWKSPQTCGPTTVSGTNTIRVIPYDNVDVLYAPRYVYKPHVQKQYLYLCRKVSRTELPPPKETCEKSKYILVYYEHKSC